MKKALFTALVVVIVMAFVAGPALSATGKVSAASTKKDRMEVKAITQLEHAVALAEEGRCATAKVLWYNAKLGVKTYGIATRPAIIEALEITQDAVEGCSR